MIVSGPIEAKDERILLASPLLQAQIRDIVEFIEGLITTSGTEPQEWAGFQVESEHLARSPNTGEAFSEKTASHLRSIIDT